MPVSCLLGDMGNRVEHAGLEYVHPAITKTADQDGEKEVMRHSSGGQDERVESSQFLAARSMATSKPDCRAASQ